MSMVEPMRPGLYGVVRQPRAELHGLKIVRLNDWYIRLTMEQAIVVLDLFAGSTPCWRAEMPVARAAALLAADGNRLAPRYSR